MKKLSMTVAVVLGMMASGFAQEGNYEERGLFGKGDAIFGRSDEVVPMLPGHGLEDDQDADGPVGSGVVLLAGLGAAYLVGKKRREE